MKPPQAPEKTNPIQTQSNPIAERAILMQSVYLQRIMKKNADKGYEKTNPISEMAKMNAIRFNTKDYGIFGFTAPKKTNPNKPNIETNSNRYFAGPVICQTAASPERLLPVF